MTETTLAYGSRLILHEGLPASLYDPGGVCWFDVDWDQGRLKRATLRLPSGKTIEVAPEVRDHPVLGRCDSVVMDGRQLTFFSSVDWADPGFIPAMEAPGRLPTGAGTVLMNFLAFMAKRPLRYRGPYPTAALFDTLSSSFRVEGDPAKAFTDFIGEVETLAVEGRMVENPVVFHPEPHELWAQGSATMLLRDGVQRAIFEGRSYTWNPGDSFCLRSEGTIVVGYVAIGGEPWFDVLRVRESGQVVSQPVAIPPYEHVLNGELVPEAMVALVTAVAVEQAPDLLKAAVQAVAGDIRWTFGDAGGENVTGFPGEIRVHALLAERLAARSPERFLRFVVDGARPHLLRQAQERLERDRPGLEG